MLKNPESTSISGASICVSPVANGLAPSLTHPTPTINPAAIAIRPHETTSAVAESDASQIPSFKTKREGAEYWYDFGFKVMPMLPGKKRPVFEHQPWASEVSPERIRLHWDEYPEHDVGAILPYDHIVLDADGPEALGALERLEEQFGVSPSLIIQTQRGVHHHFPLAKGAFAKTDSHSVEAFPDRLDIRSMGSSIMLTPSHGKVLQRLIVGRRRELAQVGQDFVDAVFQHNGRKPPRPQPEIADDTSQPVSADLATLSRLVDNIDADCGYGDWVPVLMAIFHETGGSEDGFALADSWSKKGTTYKGRADIRSKWNSFSADVANPVTIRTLIAMASAAGADVAEIMGDKFQPCETVVLKPSAAVVPVARSKPNPLQRYTLSGMAEKYRALAQNAVPLLGDVCLFGEATVWYAKHNVGKTLLMLYLLIEAVMKGRIEGAKVFYINADDSSSGLAEKLELLEELAVHTLAPGQAGFKAGDLESLMLQAVKEGSANGTLLILDTLKKFADLMNKGQSSRFANVCRQFVTGGGTILALGHINKKRGEDGKAIHAGTTDFLDDFDAGYLIDDASQAQSSGMRTVQFERLKSRGGGVKVAAYTYSAEDGVSYGERLASVQAVDLDDLDSFVPQQAKASEAEIVRVVQQCIADGINTKMALSKAVAASANISRRSAVSVIERFTGSDPLAHHWATSRIAHGALSYRLLEPIGEVVPESG